jgi:serine/threonine protein kinase
MLKVLHMAPPEGIRLKKMNLTAHRLSLLKHPAIVQILELGVHRSAEHAPGESGRTFPYAVMQRTPHVMAMVEFAMDRDLAVPERLLLFLQAVEAVEFGHGKGFLHRGLQPGNLLVDPAGRVKIMDFGLAQALDTDVLLYRGPQAESLDPNLIQYQAPEQGRTEPKGLDARCDLYALGILLYELLCDQPPFDLTRLGAEQARDMLNRLSPEKPSVIRKEVGGDLELVMRKAMEKAPEQRYASVASFRRDLECFLEHRPVSVHPPGPLYSLKLLLRRFLFPRRAKRRAARFRPRI